MQPNYDMEKICYSTDRPTFERAVLLYERGKVRNFKEVLDGYSAIVEGGKPYQVFAEAKRFGFGGCDCYLGESDVLCKHLVALSIFSVLRGKPVNREIMNKTDVAQCSGKIGELTVEQIKEIKSKISEAVRYIKPYNGPSRIWFAYQASLDEGCRRLSAVVSDLPAGRSSMKIAINLLLRLDKNISHGVDDSDGVIGGFIEETVVVLEKFCGLNEECKREIATLENRETMFGWEESLIDLTK